MKLQYLNRIDEQNRFNGLNVYINNREAQDNTHGYSYKFAREQLLLSGIDMGLQSSQDWLQERELEKIIKEKNE
jgi:hypothetical protein